MRNLRILAALLCCWKRCPDVQLEGAFTHFCVADSDPAFTALQNRRFQEALSAIRAAGFDPIAHAAADTEHPAAQGLYGMFEVFLDTVVLCTMTALVVLLGVGVENIPYGTDAGAALAIRGFQSVFGGALPGVIVAVCMALFAISSVLTWGLYGSRCCEYLLGGTAAKLYQFVFALCAIAGAVMEMGDVWAIADTLNGLMALPNLVALLALSPVVVRLGREYFSSDLRLP